MGKRVVFKYPLQMGLGDLHRVVTPLDPVVRHVGCQDPHSPTLWIEHADPMEDGRVVGQTYAVVGTGQSIPPEFEFVGTTLTSSGLMWHVYRVNES